MDRPLNKGMHHVITAILVFQLAGCGTLLYPERRGQKAGHLDAGVVILDAIGLLFFLIPGIIAFAVDFSNGTIYLPASRTSASSGDKIEYRKIKFDPKRTTMVEIEDTIRKETGYKIKLTQSNVTITRLKTLEDMQASFAEAMSGIHNNRIALSL